MRPVNLVGFEHPNFIFIQPTAARLNRSVAWLVECKHCGKEQLVGSSQAKRGLHQLCIYCQKPKEIQSREAPHE